MQYLSRLAAIVLAISLVGFAAAQDDVFEPFDSWSVMKLGGEKVGYMHSWVELNDEGQIVSSMTMRMTIRRGAVEMVIEQDSVFTETREYVPITSTSRSLMATMATEQSVIYGETGWEVTTVNAGQERVEVIDPTQGDWLTPVGAMVATQAAIARGDEEIVLSVIDPSAGFDPVESTMTKHGESEIEVFGRTVPATQWSTVVSAYPGIEIEQWLDERGQPVRQTMSLGPGMDIEILLADRDLALAEFDAPEIMANTLIQPDRPIDNPRRLRRAVYELTGPGIAELDRDQVPTTGVQSIEWVDDETLRITVDLDLRAVVDGLDASEEEYLAASSALDHEDDAIQALIAQLPQYLVAVEDVDYAPDIRDFVREFIDEKNLSVGFATASEVARTGEGDCTEHGCLLAAMLRGVGIPSRTVTGVVYADQFLQQEGVFGFHMWSQAWIETADGRGYWLDLDAAFPGNIDGFDATHIALSTSAMVDSEHTNDIIAMLPLMQGMEIKVIEEEWTD